MFNINALSVSHLSDLELRNALVEHSFVPGPINSSTRKPYESKLRRIQKALLLESAENDVDDPVVNGCCEELEAEGSVVTDNQGVDHTSPAAANIQNSPTMGLLDPEGFEKELETRNSERQEMLSRIKSLTDKHSCVREALKREESIKQHQILIMRKTHETQLEIKNSLIRNLEDIIDEQEARIFNLESHIAGIRNHSPPSSNPLGGVRRLAAQIEELAAKNLELTQGIDDYRNRESHLSRRVQALERRLLDNDIEIGELDFATSGSDDLSNWTQDIPERFINNGDAGNPVVGITNGHSHPASHSKAEVTTYDSRPPLFSVPSGGNISSESDDGSVTPTEFADPQSARRGGSTSATTHATSAAAVMNGDTGIVSSRQGIENGVTPSVYANNLVRSEPCRNCKDLEASAKAWQSRLDALKRDNGELREELRSRNDELEKRATLLEKAQRQLETARITEAESEKKILCLSAELDEAAQQISNLQSQLALCKTKDESAKEAQTSTIESLQNDLSTAMEEITALQKQLSTLICDRERADDFQQISEDLRKELEDVQRARTIQVGDLEERLSILQSSLARAKRESVTYQTRNADMIIAIDCFRSSLRALRQEQADLFALAELIPTQMRQKLMESKTQINRLVSANMQSLLVRYKNEMMLRKKYHNELIELKGNIRVFCRIRPRIPFDPAESDVVVDADVHDDTCLMVQNNGRTNNFCMDRVFGMHSTQDEIFAEVRPLVTSCVDGYSVCIFAFGQTGSGKTYTMEGPQNDPGINSRAVTALFEEAESRGVEWHYTITVSMMEIYNEMIRDLLSDDPSSYKLDVKLNADGQLHVPKANSIVVQSQEQLYNIFELGKVNRATAATNLNEHSSRSHALLSITITGYNHVTDVKTLGRLNLVDLAGSERVSKSAASGDRLKEAQCINRSLSALGDVICALRNKQSHVPFRNSKLTYLLQDSLSGQGKALMVVQVAPISVHVTETVSSLNFAQRVRCVELGQASLSRTPSSGYVSMSGQDSSSEESTTSSSSCSPLTRIPSKNYKNRTPVTSTGLGKR